MVAVPEYYVKTLVKQVPDSVDPQGLAQRVQDTLAEHLDVGVVSNSFVDFH